MIWFSRNELAHGKVCFDILTAASTTRNRVATFIDPAFKFCITEVSGGLIWEKHEVPFIKINCNGSWFSSPSRLGFGCVARDSTCLIMRVRAGFRDAANSAFEAEDYALCNAL